MRRIFQNTTAIAACLSLLSPQMAAAQAAADSDPLVLRPPSEIVPPADPAVEAQPADEASAADSAPDEEATVDGDAGTASEAEAGISAEADVTEAEAEAQPAGEGPSEEAGEAADGSVEAAAPEADTSPSDAGGAVEADAAAGATSSEGEAAPPAAEADASTTGEAEADISATEADTAETPAPTVAEPATAAPSGDTSAAEAAPADAGGQAANAAALDETASAEVTEEEVTEANSRSSSEDFGTPLPEAAASSTGQAGASAAGGNTDLARALLLGLGGVAAGAMLSNNRQVALSAPDRIVLTRPDGTRQLIRDDVVLLRQPGTTVATENFDDGSSRTVVTRADGSRVVTIRDADLRILRRVLVSADGTQTILLDDTANVEAVDVASLPAAPREPNRSMAELDEAQLREALMRETTLDRRFSLTQIRDVAELRLLAPAIDVETVNFETGSAAIPADQAESLATLGTVIRDAIASNPREMFLIEGHTDTVGDPVTNLALSDRRAESVALALVEYFQVPPENMVVQGYGEQFPKVQQEGDVRENRRASVRRITDLLASASD